MNDVFNSFGRARSVLFGDRILLFLSLFPTIIGGLLYTFMGKWLFDMATGKGQSLMEQFGVGDGLGTFLYYILAVLLAVVFFFIVNWTFVLFVSVLASPFLGLMSDRVDKILGGGELPSWDKTIKALLTNSISMIWNEFKKMFFILFFTVLAMLLNLFPLLTPVAMLISAVLLAVEFLDYNWSRYEMSFGDCFGEIRKQLFSYSLAGFIFMGLISVPILNLFVLPYAAIYFAVLWRKRTALA